MASPEMSEIVHLDVLRWDAGPRAAETAADDGGGACMSRWEKMLAFATNPLFWALFMKEIATGLWFSVRPLQFCYSEPGRTNLAGARDQYYYTREVRRAVRRVREEETATGQRRHIVLFGVSRGATAAFYAAMKLPRELAPHISLVLVEGAFNTLHDVIDASSFLPRFNMWFFRSFCDYRGAADEAEAFHFDLAQVHLRCPVAFVISAKDTRVPNRCTMQLVELLRTHLVPHVLPAVELLVLQHSRHPCMAVGHKEDQDAYVQFTEYLYRTYCA
ncbi:hypothetical protein STCU_09608 [Strigomonas culicis]|nr:hypothetical protein STCU_09608 [Strigomonas culicis]|eukprot:EPY19118.1 hypothetical protein STCU_09608 [Strigomonas culicis]